MLVLTSPARLINHTGIPSAGCTTVSTFMLCLRCAANQRRDADETQKQVTAKSQRIAEEQRECKRLEELARADLATVEPALNEAIKVVNDSFSENISQFQTALKLLSALFFNLLALFAYFINCSFKSNDLVAFFRYCEKNSRDEYAMLR